MKQNKLLFYVIVITSFMMMIFGAIAYGGSVTIQREGVPQKNGQESIVIHEGANMDGKQLKFAPRRLKDKNDSVVESATGDSPVIKQRYKTSNNGDGERKMKDDMSH